MESNQDQQHMPFFAHLEVLRGHILRSLGVILVIATLAFLSKEFVFHTLVLGPARSDFFTYRMLRWLGEWMKIPALNINQLPFILQSRQLTGQFTTHLLVSFFLGIIGASPYVAWEIWQFVKPAIPLNKYKIIYSSVSLISLLFALGVMFGYYLVTPMVIYFLAHYQVDPSIVNHFDITSYVNTVITLVLSCALMFQLPVIVYLLAKVGVVTARSMRNYRRHAIVVGLILAAIFTPPDVMSQLLIAAPLLILYEFSIVIAQFVINKENQQATKSSSKV